MGSLEKELFLACLRSDVDGVKYYLGQGANMNVICPTGRTPFGAAAQVGNIEILQLFLDYSSHCEKIKSRNYLELKAHESSLNKKSTCKETKSKRFVHAHKEQSPRTSSVPHANLTVASDLQTKHRDPSSEDLLHKRISQDNDMLMSSVHKISCDLATFNDACVRRDPRSKSKNWINEIDLYCEEEVLTPDGMDKLEWDLEIEESKEVSSGSEDPWCALYFWYTGVLLKTSSLLKEKPPPNDIDREDQFGCRALHYATIEGHVDAVKLLINAGCRVNVGDSDNLTPLHMAAARDTPDVVELLISAGANVHQKTTDRISPLHVSASRGLLNNVKLLINAGAHIDTLDSSDRSPLFMAVSRSHRDVVAYLIDHGAKVNLEEIHGYTPLYEAVWQKNTEIVKMLLNAGAKITQSHHLLHYAVLHRHEEMVRLLISAGSIINLRDENGDTPLIVAAKTHQTDISRLLLMNGASINCASYVTGNTPLHETICNMSGGCHKFEEMFSVLQEFNVDLEAESDAGYTPLCLAINRRFDDAAAALIRHGADVNHLHTVHPNLFTHVLLRGNRFLTELFVYAGYRFRDIQLPSEPSTCLEKWVSSLKINPLRLCDLCRIKIRTRFKSKVYEKVSQLMLPTSVKVFLKLEDIVSWHYCFMKSVHHDQSLALEMIKSVITRCFDGSLFPSSWHYCFMKSVRQILDKIISPK